MYRLAMLKGGAGRLTLPKHWQEFIPFAIARFAEATIDEAHTELSYGCSMLTARRPLPRPSTRDDQPLRHRVNIILLARQPFTSVIIGIGGRARVGLAAGVVGWRRDGLKYIRGGWN